MERSETIIEISKALCLFQQKVGKVKKDSNNPFFKSKYASLADILDVIQQPLSECGLSIMQMPKGDNELETLLMHTSGEWILSSYSMKPVKNDPQSIGSCITYQRRYAIGSILNLNIDEDDDGNKASNQGKQNNQQKPDSSNTKKIITRDLINNQEAMNKICDWIYRSEEKAKGNGSRFSMVSLVESSYQVGKVEMDSIMEIYNNYKVNNNLL